MSNDDPNRERPPLTLDYSTVPRDRMLLYHRVLGRLLIVIGIFVGSAVILSFLNRRPDQSPGPANRVMCAINMKQIGLGALMYANSAGGQFPDDLATLFQTQGLTANVFVCPSTSTNAPAGPTTQAIVAQLKKSGSSDYVYLGKGPTLASPPDTVLLYEPLSDHGGDGMNVLFVDGHVEWLDATEAQSILKQAASGVRPIRFPPTTAPATQPAD